MVVSRTDRTRDRGGTIRNDSGIGCEKRIPGEGDQYRCRPPPLEPSITDHRPSSRRRSSELSRATSPPGWSPLPWSTSVTASTTRSVHRGITRRTADRTPAWNDRGRARAARTTRRTTITRGVDGDRTRAGRSWARAPVTRESADGRTRVTSGGRSSRAGRPVR